MKLRLTLLVAFALLALALLAHLALRDRGGVQVTGDLAADIRSALAREVGPVTFVEVGGGAQLEIIAVTEWSKLNFVPGAIELCGNACSPESPLRLVRVIRIAIGGSRKTVFVNLQPVLSDEARQQDVFALSESGAGCLGRTLAGEFAAMKGQVGGSECYPTAQQSTLWRFAGL